MSLGPLLPDTALAMTAAEATTFAVDLLGNAAALSGLVDHQSGYIPVLQVIRHIATKRHPNPPDDATTDEKNACAEARLNVALEAITGVLAEALVTIKAEYHAELWTQLRANVEKIASNPEIRRQIYAAGQLVDPDDPETVANLALNTVRPAGRA